VGRLTLDFDPKTDQDCSMTWRRGVSVSVGALVVAVMAGGCARKEMGVRNTSPIREETTTTPTPVVTEPPTTAVTTTLAPIAIPAADPKPVGDDYRGTVIVKAVPKTDLDREILDATVALLAKRRQLALLNTSDRALLEEVMVGKSLEEYLTLGDLGPDTQLVQVPGANDRFVVNSMAVSSPDSAIAEVCEVDGASSYVIKEGKLLLKNDDIATSFWEFQLVRTAAGWRIGFETGTGVYDGVDKCEK
jgi:hypothetical protein